MTRMRSWYAQAHPGYRHGSTSVGREVVCALKAMDIRVHLGPRWGSTTEDREVSACEASTRPSRLCYYVMDSKTEK